MEKVDKACLAVLIGTLVVWVITFCILAGMSLVQAILHGGLAELANHH